MKSKVDSGVLAKMVLLMLYGCVKVLRYFDRLLSLVSLCRLATKCLTNNLIPFFLCLVGKSYFYLSEL